MVNSGSLGSSVGNSGTAEVNALLSTTSKWGRILFILQKSNAFWKHMFQL